MKTLFLTGMLLLGTLIAGRSAIYSLGTVTTPGTSLGSLQNTLIKDGNPTYVIANTMDLSAYASGNNWSLSSLTVTLSISGGCNNGLYAWLVGPGNTTVTLLNQPGYAVDGFGATGAGMNVTLQDGSAEHGYIQDETSGSVLSGTYNANNSATTFEVFNGMNPNSTWTLYFVDTIAGGGNATLNGWSLEVTAVPEPVNVALGLLAVSFAMFGAMRWCVRMAKRPDTGR